MVALLEKPRTPAASAKIKFSPEHREIIHRYVKSRRAAAEAEAMKDEVLSIVNLYGGRVIAFEAMLSRGQSVSYLYPKMILRAEEALRTEKKLAQLTGKASKRVKDRLEFSDLQKK